MIYMCEFLAYFEFFTKTILLNSNNNSVMLA